MSDTHTVPVALERDGYSVYVGTGILDDSASWSPHLGNGAVLLVSNETVAPLYADRVAAALSGREIHRHILPDGEPFKTLESWSGILDFLVAIRARRDATIIALGGGVVGDIAGFAAASYMRGIRCIQAPTSLLAQVDASVGGKTGVNHERGKNLIGAFHQPRAVIIDTDTLGTLPEREYTAGLAEVVKYGAIMDAGFLDWLEAHAEAVAAREPAALRHMVSRSVDNKARIVCQDEREGGIRAILNFGHTFGHALEAITSYSEYLHGEAVAIGMAVAARLSESRGLCPAGTADRLTALMQRLGLPHRLPEHHPTAALLDAMGLDKKAVASGLRLILLEQAGQAIIDQESSELEIEAALRAARDGGHPG